MKTFTSRKEEAVEAQVLALRKWFISIQSMAWRICFRLSIKTLLMTQGSRSTRSQAQVRAVLRLPRWYSCKIQRQILAKIQRMPVAKTQREMRGSWSRVIIRVSKVWAFRMSKIKCKSLKINRAIKAKEGKITTKLRSSKMLKIQVILRVVISNSSSDNNRVQCWDNNIKI